MPELKALYADLDGTLLGPGGSLFANAGGGVTDRAARALVALHEAGVALVLMSGRTRRGLHEVARALGASAYLAELGAILVEDHGREVVANTGAFTGDGRVVDAIARAGAGALLLERFPRRLEPVAPWTETSMMFQGLVEVAEAQALLEGSGFGWLALHDNGRLRRMLPHLDVAEVHAYHLLPKGVSKASGVRLHRERHGLDREQTAAVGDSAADVDVAGEVGRLYLVANGRDAIRDLSLPANAEITAATYGDGFADAVDALLSD